MRNFENIDEMSNGGSINNSSPRALQRRPRTARMPEVSRPASSVGAGGDARERKAAIDRGWSHQVALPSARCTGANHVTIRLFCEGLSLCERGRSFYRDGTDMVVFCFAERKDAEQFRERFGGEFIGPKNRPKWPGSPR
jgi:hypothetical protein